MLTKRDLEQVFSVELATVDLAARNASKFRPLGRRLAALWGVGEEAVAVKAIAAPKNYGNRISEATRGPIEFMVLVGDTTVDRAHLESALRGRSLRPIPTLVAFRQDGEWKVDAAFLPSGATSPYPADVPVHHFSAAPETREIDPRARKSLAALSGMSSETDVDAVLRGGGFDGRTAVLKRVADQKNLGNRIGEAIGRRPKLLVLVVSERLAEAAMQAVPERLGDSPDTEAWVVYPADGQLVVQRVEATKGDTRTSSTTWKLGNPRGASRLDWPVAPQTEFEGIPSALQPELVPVERSPAFGRPVEEGARQQQNGSTESDVDSLPVNGPQYRRLERVRLLRRHLPLDAGADALYEEHQAVDERLAFETRAITYIRELLARGEHTFVVLTGNAGHGKTHMCRRVLQEAEGHASDVMTRMIDDRLGGIEWPTGGDLPVRVIKDLSEINPPSEAAQRLELLMQQERAHVLVCANEGRLRDVVSHRPTHLRPLLDALSRGLEGGETSPEGRPDIHVVNLNYQAATGGQDGGFLNHVLDHFLNHDGAWRVCKDCAAKDSCPILANRNTLARKRGDAASDRRRAALVELVRVAEERGYVLTFREALVLVAYLVTGNLTCAEVERIHRESGSFEDRTLLHLLFEPRLNADEKGILKVLAHIRRLDPGTVALRSVDERLHKELEESGKLGSHVFGQEARQPQRSELGKERDEHRLRIRRARRTAWLVSTDGQDQVDRIRRLGLRYHGLFKRLQSNPEMSEVIEAIRLVVRGLHTIQGAVGIDSQTLFYLVDPAFGRSGSHSAVVARYFRVKDLWLWPESGWWTEMKRGESPPVLGSVEWIDRRVMLVNQKESELILPMDLLVFEFVAGCANGVVMRDFHSAERRRVLRALARHAEKGRSGADDIGLLLERGEGQLTVERDGKILLERSR